jgi:YfiH family protein
MRFENNTKAILNNESHVPFLTFPSLSKIKFVRHGFSTRLGGVSQGSLESMNLGFNRGDSAHNVDENYSRIAKSMGFHKNKFVLSDQVHNTKIRLVTSEDLGKGIVKERDYQGVDGLICNTIGIPLVTFYADCVPLYFVDIKNHAIGLSHSGWRGTVKRMGQVTLEAMHQNFGTNPKDVIALIGPSICQDCYEVSEDVAIDFKNEFNTSQIIDILYQKENGKFQLNLWRANYHVFLDAGITAENIHISEVCTCCNSDMLFSHRASHGKRGTLAAFLMLEDY